MGDAERFAFRLCEHLKFPHPDYLLPLLSAKQFREWQEYYGECPFGADRDDYLWGFWCALYANCHKKPESPAYKPQDFMPYHDPFEDDISVEEMKQSILSAFRR